MSETRYIRLVDRQPTQAGYTGLSNVSSSIEVSMELESTSAASERRTITVPFVGMPTRRAFLRGVAGIDEDDLLSQSLGFVPDELFEFVERPVVQLPVERPAAPLLDTDLGQVFENKDRVIGGDNLLRDAMVDVSHKPSFPTGYLAEFPLCRPGAFGLQFLAEMRVLRSRILGALGVKKGVIGADGYVDNPSIDAENTGVLYRRYIGMLDRDVQEENLLLPVVGDRRGFYHPGEILPVILGDRKRSLNPSSNGCNGSRAVCHVDGDDPRIVSHRGEWFSYWNSLAFDCLQRITRTVSCSLHQRGRKIRNRCTNIPVRCLVVLHFIPRMVRESPFGGCVERRGVCSHRIEESRGPTARQREFEGDCPNHSHIFAMIEQKLTGGDGQFLPGLKTGVSLPN
jgi:hypothetical protein